MTARYHSWQATSEGFASTSDTHELSVRAAAAGVFRLTLAPKGQPIMSSPAIQDPAADPLPLERAGHTFVAEGHRLEVGQSPLTVRLGPHAPVSIAPQEGGWRLELELSEGDRCYGLGEKTGFLDKRGRTYTMWNTDDPRPHIDTLDPMYVSIPWLILKSQSGAWGIFLDDPSRTDWDLGACDPDRAVVTTPRAALDLYLVAGPTLADLVGRYTALTGRMPMPPRWSLGAQQSRWSYPTAADLLQVARTYRERGIPLDVLYADIDYMHGYRVFTWNPETFRHPERLVAELGALGVRVVPIIDPGVKKDGQYEVFADGLRRGYYCLDADGVPYIGEVWPEDVAYPDFTRPEVRRWWGDLHRGLVTSGVAGIWNDMNEPSTFNTDSKTLPLDVRHGADGATPHEDVHNLYGSLMSEATREGLLRLRPDERPFVLSRAGFAGIQRHAAVWTGDNFSIWFHVEQALAMVMNMGLSGVAFAGPDVGGFSGDCTGELLARWTQIGAFTPYFRNHSAKETRHQEPWQFGPEVEEICRRYVRMRYEWLPYLYTAFWRCTRTGEPIMRPLVYDHPDDPEVASLADQAMVGRDLMVAPVFRPGATRRAVYFPAGDWIDLWSLERISGGTWRVADAPLATMPRYVRAGAVVPRGPWVPSTDELPRDRVELHVYPGEQLRGEWYDDDGHTHAHREGAYEHWRFEGQVVGDRLSLRLACEHAGLGGPARTATLVLHGLGRPHRLTFGQQPVAWSVEGTALRCELRLEPGDLIIEGLTRLE